MYFLECFLIKVENIIGRIRWIYRLMKILMKFLNLITRRRRWIRQINSASRTRITRSSKLSVQIHGCISQIPKYRLYTLTRNNQYFKLNISSIFKYSTRTAADFYKGFYTRFRFQAFFTNISSLTFCTLTYEPLSWAFVKNRF